MNMTNRNRVEDILRLKKSIEAWDSKSSASQYKTKGKTSLVVSLSKKETYKKISEWLTGNFANFCNTTALHGFNYMARKDLSKGERLFWILIVIVAILVSITLVILSWFWNRETPTVTVIESSHFPTWNIPFPAVTICNFNKISKTKALNFIKVIKKPPEVTEDDIHQLLKSTMYFGFAKNLTNVDYELYHTILEQNNLTMTELMVNLAPDCLDMISRCLWKGTNTRCDSLFQRIYTMEGICCAFNYFGLAKTNFPEKIAYQVPKLPYRVTGCGYPTGLSVLLNPVPNDYYATYFSSYGFRLLIHDSYNIPDENAETKVVTSTRESFVRISPESTYATSDVKKMDVKLRNCVFANERRLNFMQRYSFINCMAECRVKLVYNQCGCIPLNFPNNGTYPTCGFKQISCFMKYKDVFSKSVPDLNSTYATVEETGQSSCNCMSDCERNLYVSEITMGLLNEKFVYSTGSSQKNYSDSASILLHVFFSDLMSTRYRKEVFQNWLSALASFGGLLGLIMGFSIVTAFEFIYFLTFRPAFKYYMDQKSKT